MRAVAASRKWVKVRVVVGGVFHDVTFESGGDWHARDFFNIKICLDLGLCKEGTTDDWEMHLWGGQKVDFDVQVDKQIHDCDVVFVSKRKSPVERKICPSSVPQLAQHNWGMWRPYDPMRAGTAEVDYFQYHAECDNMGCTATRYAKMLVADPNEVQVKVDGVVVEGS